MKNFIKTIISFMVLIFICIFALTACNSINEDLKREDIIDTPSDTSDDQKDRDDNPNKNNSFSGSSSLPNTSGDNSIDDSSDENNSFSDSSNIPNTSEDNPIIDPPIIPDEIDSVKIVLPENVDQNILSYIYASISIDLISYGYEVFNGYVTTENGKEYGIAYTDSKEVLKFENDDKLYFSTGFLGFSMEETVSTSQDLLFVQPVDENAEDIIDDKYGYIIACIEEGIPTGHFIASGKYIKYSVISGKVKIEALENKSSNYDLSMGAIFDYDRQDLAFMPYDDIDSSPIEYVTLSEDIDYEKIENNLFAIIEEQQAKGYSVQTITISFLSVDTLNALRGILAQGDSLNGYTFEELDNIDFDSAKQYIQFNSDGSITLKDLPPIPITQYKSLFDWLIDGLVLIGTGAIAIVSVTFLGPAGGVIASAVLGAGMEYFNQTVIGGKKFSEVNWAKVGIMAISGALGAMVPCAGTLGYIAAGAVGGLTSAALTAIEGGSWKEILVSAGTGALTSMLMHGLFASCFPAGTQVLTKEGYLPIELVTVGMLIASYNIFTSKMEWKPVLDTYKNLTTSLVRVNFSNGDSVLSTANHPYYVASKKTYISAELLKSGDMLLSTNNELYVTSVEKIALESEIFVYNLHIADNNNYFVDDSNILVHNSCKHQEYEWRKTRKSFWKEEADLKKYAGKVYELTDDNLALMKNGKAPLDSFNKRIELHHIKGINNSMADIIPLDKATHTAFHRAKGYVDFTAQDLFDFLKSINLFDIYF